MFLVAIVGKVAAWRLVIIFVKSLCSNKAFKMTSNDHATVVFNLFCCIVFTNTKCIQQNPTYINLEPVMVKFLIKISFTQLRA